MKIELITTGDELMSGLTRDGNFEWAGDVLTSLGMRIAYHTTVGDDRAALAEALGTANTRAEAVIVTGGLGPTDDDLTAEVAGRYFKVPLVLNESALEQMEKILTERGRGVSETNKKQAYLPVDSTVLQNHCGTAPGFGIESGGTVFFFLPGVPKEFQAMMREYVIPELDWRDGDRRKTCSKLVKTFGLPESEVAAKLKGIEREGAKVGYRSTSREIHLRLTTFAQTETQAQEQMSELLADIHSRIGSYVSTTEGHTMEEVVGKLLKEQGMTLSAAESCTGGLLSHRITNVPGSSEYFLEGVVAYSNEAKTRILGVPEVLIENHGAVSAPVAEAMAKGVRELAGSDIGASISGIAGPGGGSAEKPVGTVFIGIDSGITGTISKRFLFHGSREEIKLVTTLNALEIIRQILVNNV